MQVQETVEFLPLKHGLIVVLEYLRPLPIFQWPNNLTCVLAQTGHQWSWHFNDLIDRIAKLASQKAVVIFSKCTCCMCHAIKRLLYEQGVSHMIHELNENSGGKQMEWALMRLRCSPAVPTVFIGGKFVSSANTFLTLHLNGSLKKLLKDGGALWL
ncbi:Glutaredoxin domain-containing protein [Forsythia ovata]|uniref:Glutaredoxin domain-containing protein n=1 Tax=Forsythia ovata TaxID=205694 RepID=A0ABD1V0L0_9LAMI